MHVADFETTTLETDCRVWAWGIYDINNDSFNHGKDILSFFKGKYFFRYYLLIVGERPLFTPLY
jgi:hypothetical protein